MSKILKSVRRSAKRLHDTGHMNDVMMREFDALCLDPCPNSPQRMSHGFGPRIAPVRACSPHFSTLEKQQSLPGNKAQRSQAGLPASFSTLLTGRAWTYSCSFRHLASAQRERPGSTECAGYAAVSLRMASVDTCLLPSRASAAPKRPSSFVPVAYSAASRAASAASGKVHTTVVPCPGTESIRTVPRCRSTNERTIDSPRPAPR
jgi:hypothetical protein